MDRVHVCLPSALPLLVALLAVPATADDVRDAYRAYQQLWSQGKKQAACEALGGANTLKAAQTLLKIMLQHQVAPKNEKPAAEIERRKVIDGCTAGFARFTDAKVLQYLSGMAARRQLSPEQKAPILLAFGKMKSEAGARELLALRGKLTKLAEKILIAEAMESSGLPLLVDTWLKDLSSPYWMIQVAAIKSLARRKEKRSVAPLIELLTSDHPKVSYWAHQALLGMSGIDNGTDPQEWKNWWAKDKDKPLAGEGLGSKPKKKQGSVSFRVPTYYGKKFHSKRVAFVIDISGSMGEMVKDNLKRPAPSKLDTRPPAMRYDWDSIRNRMDLGKAHLVYTIGHLDQRTWFNIFYYASNSATWREKGWVQATRAGKIAAIERVKKLAAGGGTNIYEALQRSFEFPGKGPAPLEQSVQKGADTIFLMTDGDPTSGAITRTTPEYRLRFVRAVRRWSAGRKVTVHTVGIGKGHDSKLLADIAKAAGGTYTTAGD